MFQNLGLWVNMFIIGQLTTQREKCSVSRTGSTFPRRAWKDFESYILHRGTLNLFQIGLGTNKHCDLWNLVISS